MSDSFVCPVCGAESYNPNDIEHKYCGRCHAFTGDESFMLQLAEWLADKPCPDCGELSLRVVGRDGLLAKPLGSFSLAGAQPKVSAHEVRWPWAKCSTPGCSFEKKAKLGQE